MTVDCIVVKIICISICLAVRNLTVNFYGTGELFIDGVKQTLKNYKNWRKADTVQLPNNAHVIAVRSKITKCKEGSNFITTSDESLISDESWKCQVCDPDNDDFTSGKGLYLTIHIENFQLQIESK